MTSEYRSDFFQRRHLGPGEDDVQAMLETCKASTLEQLVEETIPTPIRLRKELDISDALGESELLEHLRKIAEKNKIYKSYLGLGYHDCYTPNVILRNIMENPGWYTQYTPYQPEISQGRLEALLNFQTMVIDLTGMEIANASLLDEGTAAAEAMTLAYRVTNKRRRGAKKDPARSTGRNPGKNKFFISDECFETSIAIMKTRAEPLNIESSWGIIARQF